jgi:hypothetical protein
LITIVNIKEMKKIIPLLMFTAGLVSGQSITRVDFQVLPGDLVEVTYSLVDTEPNMVYDIALYASLDGGYYFPIRAHSVIGDIGPRVRGSGRKTIRWKVMDDVPRLVSDNLVLKVTGAAKPTVAGVVVSVFTGTRFTKRMSDGFTIFGGRGLAQTQDSEYFTDLIDNSRLNLVENYRFGFRVTRVPFVYRLELYHRAWDLNFDSETTDRLRFLFAATEADVDRATKLNYTGFSWGMAYTPLPVFGIFLPQVGGGLSYNYFNMGDEISSKGSVVANPGIFAEIGLQTNLFRWLKLNIGLRRDFMNPQINFTRSYLEVGLHFSSR